MVRFHADRQSCRQAVAIVARIHAGEVIVSRDPKKAASGSWIGLVRELAKRTVDPIGHATFVIYFILAVVIAGGAGVWLELFIYLAQSPAPTLGPLRTAVITFFAAVAGSACMQLIWAEDDNRALRAYATLVLIVILIAALIIGIPTKIPAETAIGYGALATLVSLWTWWVANAKQKDLLDPVNPDDALGGNPNDGLAGNLQGFKT